MNQANISTAKSQLSRLIELVKAGEQVVISDRDQPVAVLVPFRETLPDDPWSARVSELGKRGQLTMPRHDKGPHSGSNRKAPVQSASHASLSECISEGRREDR